MQKNSSVHMLTLGDMHPVLIQDENSLVLVDTGFPGQYDSLKEAIEEAGYKTEDITHLVYTHQDLDHIGSGPQVKAAAKNLQVLAHRLEAPCIDGREVPVKLAERMAVADTLDEAGRQNISDMQRGFAICQIPIDHELEGGVTLPIAGGIEIIHTPGHTPGHICLYLPAHKAVIVGDAMGIQNGQLCGPTPMYTQNMDLAKQSLAPLCKRAIDTVYTYHGGIFSGNVQNSIRAVIES